MCLRYFLQQLHESLTRGQKYSAIARRPLDLSSNFREKIHMGQFWRQCRPRNRSNTSHLPNLKLVVQVMFDRKSVVQRSLLLLKQHVKRIADKLRNKKYSTILLYPSPVVVQYSEKAGSTTSVLEKAHKTFNDGELCNDSYTFLGARNSRFCSFVWSWHPATRNCICGSKRCVARS